jgi:hypothetical protein
MRALHAAKTSRKNLATASGARQRVASLQVDPFVGSGWNAYGYVDHNPVAKSDKRGLASDSEEGPQPNMCSRDQIEGGYEEIDGECVLTGWNWGYVGGGGGRWIDGCITRACEPGFGDWYPPSGGWPPQPPEEPPLEPSCEWERQQMEEACWDPDDPEPTNRLLPGRGLLPARPFAPQLKASAGKADLPSGFAPAITGTKPTLPVPGGGGGGTRPDPCPKAIQVYLECLAKGYGQR